MNLPVLNKPEKKLKVLLEMRPALDGHAGIPQETRLLFRALRLMPQVEACGLLQSSGHMLAEGLPTSQEALAAMPSHRRINRLSRVVVSLRQGLYNPHLGTVSMLLRRLIGRRERLSRFDPTHFRDFVWRSLFARTLHPEDIETVVGAEFRVARVPWTAMHRCALAIRNLGHALYPRLDTSDFDLMISETPYPGIVSPRTRLIVRYHDAIPLLMPHTISNKNHHQASHYQALRRNVADGAHFACVSEATRRDLLSVFPEVASRAVTIHNMVSGHYYREDSPRERVPEIIKTRRNTMVGNPADISIAFPSANVRYLLVVSTIEPRKNHATLLSAWEQLRANRFPGLRLVVVGALGWDHETIVKKFLPWIERGDVLMLEDVPSAELRKLYRHASATICPSFGEGFDFSGVEAMRCGSPVVASDIPVHREVYANAAAFFSPYSVADAVSVIDGVIRDESAKYREQLLLAGDEVSARYRPEKLMPAWTEFLRHCAIGAKE